jgi:Fe-S cluster biosynthesis and repair protein YggX
MTEGTFVKFNSKDDVKKNAKYLIENMLEWDFSKPLAVKLEQYQDPRSLNQNALFHVWCREIAKGMEKKGFAVSEGVAEEAWKLWLKKRFLGINDYKISKTVITGQVKSSSALNKGDMVHFMDQCYHWATEQGIRLTIPAESEYAELKKQQEK